MTDPYLHIQPGVDVAKADAGQRLVARLHADTGRRVHELGEGFDIIHSRGAQSKADLMNVFKIAKEVGRWDSNDGNRSLFTLFVTMQLDHRNMWNVQYISR